jgi:predicted ATP-grasp superfamily ATP-dependent carboligase
LRGELPEPLPPQPAILSGKAVVFARQNTAITETCLERLMELVPDGGGSVRVADVPFRATRVQKGHPLLTVFSQGRDERSVLAGLQQNARRIYEMVSDLSL